MLLCINFPSNKRDVVECSERKEMHQSSALSCGSSCSTTTCLIVSELSLISVYFKNKSDTRHESSCQSDINQRHANKTSTCIAHRVISVLIPFQPIVFVVQYFPQRKKYVKYTFCITNEWISCAEIENNSLSLRTNVSWRLYFDEHASKDEMQQE